MQVIIEFPHSMWISKNTIRFSFKEEISHSNFYAVQAFNRFLKKQLRHHLVECVASYHTVTAYVKQRIDVDLLRRQWLDSQASTAIDDKTNRLLKIPVCYDEEFALDRQRVMDYTGLSFADIKMLHLSKSYYVYLIGFLPGFPYLGELDSKLFVPRLGKPRASVSASSVGVGGGQTGIYPVDSPGGWNIIGKTPFELFNINGKEPFLFELGDEVQFYEITKQQYWEMKSKGV
ncbi:5-oxoprolinase subunit PxpB [Lysinibacillus fusiformis]|uniref:5-oxoprolinase subunit PxpB n=1 Tax=Lysinibacillus fusiformis TaxID=28031 RepID=UPI002D7890A1|nr:5-oxoprolinase subunit PxpB [Lysinibacillus fusiformis]WRT00205.1 5-oxoprolinase subunit PxpB [Lysinibacillus fusiformis]